MSAVALPEARTSRNDLGERRLLFDASWPLIVFIMVVSYLLAWWLDLLDIDLPMVLWTSFILALSHQTLSRVLDYVEDSSAVELVYLAFNIAAIAGLAIIWSMLGGLSAPAFAIFFALPIITFGLIANIATQFAVAIYTIILAWSVAIRHSADLRLQLEYLGMPSLGDVTTSIPATEFGGGIVAGGVAQMQFMVVFSVAILGVALVSAMLVAMIHLLSKRLRFASTLGKRAETLVGSFLTQDDGLELIVDRDSFQVIAVSPSLANEIDADAAALIGCHYTSVLPFPEDHPALRSIESGSSALFTHQVFSFASGKRLANIRIHPGTSDGFAFQRITILELRLSDYAEIAAHALDDISGVINTDGRILQASRSLQKLLAASGKFDSANSLPLPAGWWQIGVRKRHSRHVNVANVDYRLDLNRTEFFSTGQNLELTAFRLSPTTRP